MRKAFHKNRIAGLTLAVVASSFLFYASSTGITGKTKKNGQGCTCHGSSPTTSVNVVIDGPSQLNIGETGNYTVTITGGTLTRGGTNIAASAGTLIAGAGLQLLSGELTHTAPAVPNNNAVTFSFQYTAPSAAGNVTLFANGNSVNFNGGSTGDNWNFATDKIVTISSSTDLNDNAAISDFRLEQNYPNPFNPSTVISFQLAALSNVGLKIYDILGNEVAVLIDNELKEIGRYNYQFSFLPNGTVGKNYQLQSGVYFYQLRVSDPSTSSGQGFVETKKMILLR